MKVKKNFLEKDYFNRIKSAVVNNETFPFYFKPAVAGESDKKTLKQFYFAHVVYDNHQVNSETFNLLLPLLEKMDVKALIRIKVNLYSRTDKLLKHYSHVDDNFKHKGMILSLNTCNGGTTIGKKFVQSIENQALFFDPSVGHNSTNCTDQQGRWNININYF